MNWAIAGIAARGRTIFMNKVAIGIGSALILTHSSFGFSKMA